MFQRRYGGDGSTDIQHRWCRGMKIAIAQVNTIIGDIDHNKDVILQYIKEARKKDSDIICFPELTITGYPPCDLLYNSRFIGQCEDALEEIAKEAYKIDVLLGAPILDSQSELGRASCR